MGFKIEHFKIDSKKAKLENCKTFDSIKECFSFLSILFHYINDDKILIDKDSLANSLILVKSKLENIKNKKGESFIIKFHTIEERLDSMIEVTNTENEDF